MKLSDQIKKINDLIEKYPELKGADVSIDFRSYNELDSYSISYAIVCIKDKRFNHSIRVEVYQTNIKIDFDYVLKLLKNKIEFKLNPDKLDNSDIEI